MVARQVASSQHSRPTVLTEIERVAHVERDLRRRHRMRIGRCLALTWCVLLVTIRSIGFTSVILAVGKQSHAQDVGSQGQRKLSSASSHATGRRKQRSRAPRMSERRAGDPRAVGTMAPSLAQRRGRAGQECPCIWGRARASASSHRLGTTATCTQILWGRGWALSGLLPPRADPPLPRRASAARDRCAP